MPRSYYFNQKGSFSFLEQLNLLEADVFIVDIDDATKIFLDEKWKNKLLQLLESKKHELYIRINGENLQETSHGLSKIDGHLISGWAIHHVMPKNLNRLVMKAREYESLQKLDFGKINFIAIIDSPEGVISYRKIAKYERVKALFFDEKKYRDYLGWNADANIDFAYQQIAFASSLSKKPLIDRICEEPSLLLDDLKRGKKFGCTAKATNQNDQIEEINQFYTPSQEEINQAFLILNAISERSNASKRNLVIDGKEISQLQIYRSQELLTRSEQYRQTPLTNNFIIKSEKLKVAKKVYVNKKFYTFGEEIGNSITHGVGILLSLVMIGFLIVKGLNTSDSIAVLAYLIYGMSALLLYSSSTLYHGLPLGSRAKKLFQKFDHMTIYLLIAGTYTPFTLLAIGGQLGTFLCLFMWALALIGLIMNVFWFGRFKSFHMILYVGLGWMAFFYLDLVIKAIGLNGTLLLLAGGIAYTLGIIFYSLKLFKFTHMVWHIFVILGTLLHFLSIYFYVG